MHSPRSLGDQDPAISNSEQISPLSVEQTRQSMLDMSRRILSISQNGIFSSEDNASITQLAQKLENWAKNLQFNDPSIQLVLVELDRHLSLLENSITASNNLVAEFLKRFSDAARLGGSRIGDETHPANDPEYRQQANG